MLIGEKKAVGLLRGCTLKTVPNPRRRFHKAFALPFEVICARDVEIPRLSADRASFVVQSWLLNT